MTYYPREVPRHLEYSHRLLQQLLEDSAQHHPEAPVTSFYGGVMTYLELDQEANRFANSLLGLGVQPGDRVAIHLPNCPQLLISLFGTLKAGAVATLANPLYESRELAHQLNDSGAGVMVTLSQNRILGNAITAREHSGVHHLIVTNIKEYFPPKLRLAFTAFKEKKEGHRARLDPAQGQIWFKDLLKGQSFGLPDIAMQPSDTALLQYTGGTTGVPRGAELTHGNLVANAEQSRSWLYDLQEAGEKMLMVLPLFHVYALTCCNFMLASACQLTLLPRFDLANVIATIQKERPTIFPGIPAMYAAINHSLLRGDDRNKADLSSIRFCISGSDRLPVQVQEEFERLSGGRLVEGYGLTEASPVTHVNPIYGKRKAGSIGLPLPDTEVRIVDLETGKDVPEGSEGEMLVRGPQVMRGYWQASEETAAAIDADGWLKTGDVAHVDEDGFYFIMDRRKDVIITGGINVYPREIEDVLAGFDKIGEVAVKGVPHRLRGETIKAYVVLKENETATPAEIRAFAKERLADFKVPQKIEFLDELPKSTLHKVLKRKLSDN